jgi:hypothetical protein
MTGSKRGPVTTGLRTQLRAEVARARLFAAECRASCLRRAVELGELREHVTDGLLRGWLQTAVRDCLALGESADNLLATLDAVAAIPDDGDGNGGSEAA